MSQDEQANSQGTIEENTEATETTETENVEENETEETKTEVNTNESTGGDDKGTSKAKKLLKQGKERATRKVRRPGS